MTNDATNIADAINKSLRGFKVGTVEIWGAMPVRPDDQAYAVAAATVDGNRVDIEFEDKTVVSIWDPGRFKSFPKEDQPFFLIADASRVRWGKGYDASQSGGELVVQIGGKKKKSPASQASAIILRASRMG
jgi:hypothetical protein